MTLQMRASLSASRSPGQPACLIVWNHFDAIYKHSFLGEDELRLVLNSLRYMAAELNTIVFVKVKGILSVLFLSSLAFGKNLVDVLIKYFADFKCTIDTVNKSSTVL